MKIKLRRFTAVISAMLCMICCVVSAVPAFADDLETKNTLANVKWQSVSSVSDVPYSSNVINFYKESHSDLPQNYILIYSKYSDGTNNISMLCFPDDAVVGYYFPNNQFRYMSNTDYNSFGTYRYFINFDSGANQIYRVGVGRFGIQSPDSNYRDAGISYHFGVDGGAIETAKVYIHCKLYDWDDLENEITPADPNAPVKPFTVSFNPSLKTGLVRKGTLVAPGAENDGQEVETNSIAVTVKMTDEFINVSKPISGAFTYSYQFTCFVIPSEYKDSDIKTMSEHAIYTAAQDNLNYLYYENETLDIDDSLSSQPSTGELAPVSEQWANATGVSNCFVLERDNNTPLRNVTIDLHNIDFENNKSDSYNIVILGHIVRKSEYGWTAYPSYFKSDCSSLALESTKEYPMNFGSEDEPVTNKTFYEYYSVISDNWSFKDYPKYEPHKVGGVTVGDSPLDFKKTAKGVQDYNMWEQGGNNNTLAPDDFDKYKEQKQLDENFGSTDFGIDSIKGVFDGSSDFFKFLTASIAILPTTFLTILISFFVVMLAICVVKWIL